MTLLQTTPICIATNDLAKAKLLSQELSLKLCDDISQAEQWLDWVKNKKDPTLRLSLCSHHQGPVSVDFLAGKKAHRQQFGGGKGQPLVRAMGQINNDEISRLPTVIDATAGMGGDSYVLASLGFKVQMLERSPIVAALLKDALQRAQQTIQENGEGFSTDICQSIANLSLCNADSAQYLLEQKPDIDVIYILGDATETRLIKPYLDVNVSTFAERIPLYASSKSHSKQIDRTDKGDLDGLYFTELPWMLDGQIQQHNLRQQYESLWPENADISQRLFAMAFDAASMLGDVKQLSMVQGKRFSGISGQLSIASNGYVTRSLDWAQYKNKKIIAVDLATEQPIPLFMQSAVGINAAE